MQETIKEVFNPIIETIEIRGVKPKKYKTKIRATSIESFYHILENIGDRQLECLKAIRKLQPVSDRQLKDYLGWEINQVNGRRNELLKMGIILKYKEGTSEKTKRKVIFWKIKSYLSDVMN
jgi:predicted transcriptional regulator